MSPLLLLLALAGPVHASAKSDYTSGIVAFEGRDYAKAEEKLTVALAVPEALKARDLPKGYLYLARAILNQQPVSHERLLEAGRALARAKETDTDNRFTRDLEHDLPWMQGELLKMAFDHMGEGATDANRATAAATLDVMDRLQPGDWLVTDMRATLALDSKDMTGALTWSLKALELYEAKPPSPQQPAVATSAMRAALLLTAYREPADADPQAALDAIAVGLRLLAAMEAGLTGQELASVPGRREELERMRLQVLMNAPSLAELARAEFKAAWEAHPEDPMLGVAYAKVLEGFDMAQAEATYKAVLDAHPDSFIAAYNLGAVYVNALAPLEARRVALPKPDKALDAETDALARKALGAFEIAHRIQPADVEVLRQLVGLSLRLDDNKKAEAYEVKLKAARGG